MLKYPHLPPLQFLPTFEAAARLSSFKEAALELGLTPSAVSQQIKQLEERMGLSLFERETRAIHLTPDGERLQGATQDLLAELDVLARSLRRRNEKPTIRISTVPTAAHELLIPHLDSFQARFPDHELRVETSMKMVDFRRDPCDAALRMGIPPWEGLSHEYLGPIDAGYVCTPALAARIKHLADIADHTLIAVRGHEERTWAPLAKRVGFSLARCKFLTFETYLETLRATEAGLGITAGLFPLTTGWVLSGRLAVPLPIRTRLTDALYLVYPPKRQPSHIIEELCRWLTERYAAMPPLPPGIHGAGCGG